jgi:hypothetical protein
MPAGGQRHVLIQSRSTLWRKLTSGIVVKADRTATPAIAITTRDM